jgi:hypothetical protein
MVVTQSSYLKINVIPKEKSPSQTEGLPGSYIAIFIGSNCPGISGTVPDF